MREALAVVGEGCGCRCSFRVGVSQPGMQIGQRLALGQLVGVADAQRQQHLRVARVHRQCLLQRRDGLLAQALVISFLECAFPKYKAFPEYEAFPDYKISHVLCHFPSQ